MTHKIYSLRGPQHTSESTIFSKNLLMFSGFTEAFLTAFFQNFEEALCNYLMMGGKVLKICRQSIVCKCLMHVHVCHAVNDKYMYA